MHLKFLTTHGIWDQRMVEIILERKGETEESCVCELERERRQSFFLFSTQKNEGKQVTF